MTLDEKIEHVSLCRKTDGISSRFEIPLVLEGIVSPIDGKSIEDYQAQWDDKVKAYETRTAESWPHPRGE